MTNQRVSTHERVFVDTSAFYAVIDNNDQNHNSAVAIMRELARHPSKLFTTNFILAETYALLLTRLGRNFAIQFLEGVETGSTTMVRASAVDEKQARIILKKYYDKNFSLTDAISFSVVDRLKISHSFSFDKNFVQYGLHILTG